MDRNNHPVEIDHIDPRWKEGRDYQLVCGLDCPLNYREEDWKKNTAKSNRFLPWRWSRDEIGVVPEERGDLAQFLVNGEWVLLEFLSDEWFEASRGTNGASALRYRRDDSKAVRKQWETLRQNPELLNARNQKIANTCKERNTIESAQEAQREWRDKNPTEYSASKRHASMVGKKYRYKCTVTGHISTAGGLTLYQQHRGIDPSNRIQIN
jgi:hypothetical protein